MNSNINRPPWWFTIILMVMAVPLFLWPVIMHNGLTDVGASLGTDESFLVNRQFFSIGFPIFAVLALYFSYITYTLRRDVSIILLVILALSYAAIPWIL